MKIELLRRRGAAGKAGLLLASLLISSTSLGQTVEKEFRASSVTLEIGHRLYPDFHQRVRTMLNERQQVGDSEWFFEVVEFYPHFAYRDSTKTVVSLSGEPKNPAFKIRVYENDKFVEDTWAFYAIKVPHFSPRSYLTFHALQFEYQGKTYGNEGGKTDDGE